MLLIAPVAPTWAADPHAPSDTLPAAVAAALDAGTALTLIEVSDVKERDARPKDGNLVDIVSFEVVKSSGKPPASIEIIKAFGGRRARGSPRSTPGGPLFPNPLVAGQRYWVVFNDTDRQKYQQGVVAWWPEKSAPTTPLEAAIAADKFGKTKP
jgi:hypothetical protein